MRHWQIIDNKLELKTTEIPKAKRSYALIKVSAIGINRADTLQIKGLYPSPDGSVVPGLEVSGTIVGTDKKVCALLTSDGFAEYVRVPEQHVLPIPSSYNLVEAAALPEALITTFLNIFCLGKLKQGEYVLIHGATSGIGSFAVKLCKAYGANVFSSVGSDEKIEICGNLGADSIFNYTGDWVDNIKRIGGVDLLLDILGGDYFDKNISVMNKNGRIITIAVMDSAKAQVNAASILMKNLIIQGSTLRSKSKDKKATLIRQAIRNLHPLIERNMIKPEIDSVHSFVDLPKAIERLESRKHFGKIVVTV